MFVRSRSVVDYTSRPLPSREAVNFKYLVKRQFKPDHARKRKEHRYLYCHFVLLNIWTWVQRKKRAIFSSVLYPEDWHQKPWSRKLKLCKTKYGYDRPRVIAIRANHQPQPVITKTGIRNSDFWVWQMLSPLGQGRSRRKHWHNCSFRTQILPGSQSTFAAIDDPKKFDENSSLFLVVWGSSICSGWCDGGDSCGKKLNEVVKSGSEEWLYCAKQHKIYSDIPWIPTALADWSNPFDRSPSIVPKLARTYVQFGLVHVINSHADESYVVVRVSDRQL